MNTFKKTTTMLLTLMVIIITSTTTFSKAGWTDCLWNDGKNGHTWYEAADGKVKKVTKTGWTADNPCHPFSSAPRPALHALRCLSG